MRKIENDRYTTISSTGSHNVMGDEVKDFYAVYYCDFCKHKIGSMLESKDITLSKESQNYRLSFGEERVHLIYGKKTLVKKMHFCCDACRESGVNLEIDKLVNLGYKEDEIKCDY